MKYIIIISSLIVLFSFPAFAHAVGSEETLSALSMPLPDYLSNKPIVLNDKERLALELAEEWARASSSPFRDVKGRLIFVHGASVPTVIASPYKVCDIELEPGEKLREIIIGDSARWLVDSATSGSPAGQDITHIMLKPVDAGLETSAVITTDRRVYHLRLVSQKEGYIPYIGFAYQESFVRQYQSQLSREEKARTWQSFEHDQDSFDLSQLNFDYSVEGYASWKPSQVYDTGRQTYIVLPASARYSESPVLLVHKNDADVLVNYRVKGITYIVDGVHDHYVLVLGVGYHQEKINIIREGR